MLRRFRKRWPVIGPLIDRSASVMIMTALSMPLLLTVIGFAADYGYASYLNQRLARACDTAVLSAASQAAATAVGSYANTTGLQQYGTRIFNENIKDLQLSNAQFQLTVTQNPSTTVVTTVATYTYSTKTFFSNFFGISAIPVGGTITATVQPPTYINYYLVVDVSNSMGVGATQADMTTLFNALKAKGFVQSNEAPGCVFGCHTKSWNQSTSSYYPYTTEDVARQNNVTLRIDSAVAAINSIINSAASIAGTTKNISIGLYLLQANPDTGKQIVALSNGPSTNYANLLTLASTIDLGSNGSDVGDTDFQNGLAAFNAILPSNGSGASAASPLNYVFLVTDGVGDQVSGSCQTPAPGCSWTINASWCAQIKSKATLGVIYTTYLPMWLNNDPSTKQYGKLYTKYVYPIKDQILPNLQGCSSSSDYFFEAVDGPAITTTMQALFAKSQPVSTRLTR